MNKTLELILRLPIMLAWWLVQAAIKLPYMLIGLVAIPFTYKYRNVPLNALPWYIKMFANPEDQFGGYPGFEDSLPAFWKKAHGTGMYAHWKYHAIRNPADGLRNVKWLNVMTKMPRIKYFTDEYMVHYEPYLMGDRKVSWYICWQDFWLGVNLIIIWSDTRHLIFKFGFRLKPSNAIIPLDPASTTYRIGSSFATKFLPYREWKRR